MSIRYVIVGIGVAGIAAAEAIREADAAGKITLISDDPHGYYSRPGLAYYLTDEIPRSHLFPWTEAEFKHLGLHRIYAQAIRLETAENRLILADGAVVAYDRLLLATGSAAVWPNIPESTCRRWSSWIILTMRNGFWRWPAKRARPWSSAAASPRWRSSRGCVSIVAACITCCAATATGPTCWMKPSSRIVADRLAAEGVQLHYRTELAAVEAAWPRGRRPNDHR